MDYKQTLNLPKTGFPMKADLVAREPQRLKKWEAMDLYARIQKRRGSARKFVLHDGPPFANGDVHIGTALNKVLKDFVVKYQTLRGHHAPYVPGWDCHGLPIEFKVVQALRNKGSQAEDPVAVRRACDASARKYIDLQRIQFQRLGVLGDWKRPYLTLNPAYEAEELRLFADLVEQGFVYRGKKPVYWSIPCRTALAEAEVEYKDHVSPSIYVKFPVVGRPHTYVLIWTTTPWTLPANLAIAYHSAIGYSLVQVGRENYLLSTLLLPSVAAKCGWKSHQIKQSLQGDQLAQIQYQHPFIARQGRLFAGDAFVDNSTGTGFVHVAPGHGLEDYGLGRQVGLPIYSPIDNDGRLQRTEDFPADQQMPDGLVGKSVLEKQGRSEANEAVLDLLREKDLLLLKEDYTHSYPHCWRSKTPVIFRAMDQWFLNIEHRDFRQRALETIRRVEWIPAWGRNRIEAAVQSRPDWCISRQRTWGVPLPAFFGASGKPILEPGLIRRVADRVQRQGSNFWFEQTAADLWAMVRPADWKGDEAVAKSQDTLDVWIDSGSSSRAVLMRRPELGHPERSEASFWQADLYLEGSDQHRGWFQSSLLLSLAAHGAPPFKAVLTHGFMVDADREKISKSKQGQGYQKPQTAQAYVQQHGADIVRLWVASQDFRNDIIVSEERIQKVAETYRVLRNAFRYQLANLQDFAPPVDAVPPEDCAWLDRWMLETLSVLEQEVLQAYNAYEFHVVYQKISQFAAVELSAVYHDLIKDRLYTEPRASQRRRSTQTVLLRLCTDLCKMLAPLLAFTADEAWEHLPGEDRTPSVHLAHWQPFTFQRPEKERELGRALFSLRTLALTELEKARQSKIIGKSLEAELHCRVPLSLYREGRPFLEDVRELFNVSQIQWEPLPGQETTPVLVVRHAAGAKCQRCWRWQTDVGSEAAHPDLCGRCAAIVTNQRVVSP